MAILVQVSEATATLRRMYFHCVDAADGITAEVGEAAGQPQISLNGAAWGNSTNILVAIGNGRYYVELVAATEVNAVGIIEGRYKSAATAESVGTTLQVVPYDPYDGVRMGLTALPNAVPQAAGGIVTSTAGAEFDSRTLLSADYTVVGDTLAGGTNCGTVTGNVNGSVGSLAGHTGQSGDGYAIVNHVNYGNAKLVRSTTPANKLDVSATGEAGLDFANIKDATTHTTIDISVNVALATTLAVRTSDSVFTINAGSAVNDAYNNMVLALYDVTGTLWETRKISDYAGGTKTVTVDSAFSFVVVANDVIKIYMNAYAPTVAAGGGATATEVWAHDVSGNVTQGQVGNYQTIIGGRYG